MTCPQVDPSLDCPKCPAYRDLVADALAKLRGIFEYANTTETAAQNRYETDMRWAQGLYILHEAVLKKEMKTPAPAPDMLTSGIPIQLATVSALATAPFQINSVAINCKLRHVFNLAMAELEKWRNLPSGSHKWTWGPKLSMAEVGDLITPAQSGKHPHSGYRESLQIGRAHV